jgi:hypothetical protein
MNQPAFGPITTKALERLRAMAEGNGLDAAAITVLKSDEREYRMLGQLQFAPRYELGIATPQEMKALPAEPLPSADSVRQLAAQADFPSGWHELAGRMLRDLPGGGWGAEAQALRLDEFTRLYAVADICTGCGGAGQRDCDTCQRTGQVDCDYCAPQGRPTGRDPQNPSLPCPQCQGTERARCRKCNGNGAFQCPTCRGAGQKTTTYALKMYADIRFGWRPEGESGDFPTPLLRSIDRAGVAKLGNGHAKVDRGQFDSETVDTIPTLHLTATLPFATAQFSIAGEKLTAHLLGYKGAILELPTFLDSHLQTAAHAGTLHTLRIYREAQLLSARRGTGAELVRHYPAGLSRTMADKLVGMAARNLHTATRTPRWQGFGLGLGAAVVIGALYLFTPLRTLGASLGDVQYTDIAMILVLPALFIGAQYVWLKRAMEKQLGQKHLKPPVMSHQAMLGVALVIIGYAIALYIDRPTWLQLYKLWAEAYYDYWINR